MPLLAFNVIFSSLKKSLNNPVPSFLLCLPLLAIVELVLGFLKTN